MSCKNLLVRLSVAVASLAAISAVAQEQPVPAQTAEDGNTGAAAAAPAVDEEVTDSADRTELNLLGEVDSESGEARRNENVRLTLINNNVLKELNVRIGTTATMIEEFDVQRNYFGREFGGAPSSPVHIAPSPASSIHGSLFWNHSNSALRARSFFQVGAVQPSRSNDYGASASMPMWEGASFSFNASQGKNLGQVNGNVLVPAADERTVIVEPGLPTEDPAVYALVERILAAYPAEVPNRTDINPRALNTNAPQNINNNRIGGSLNQSLSSNDNVVMRYNFTGQFVEAFQLVGGQNPDTTTKNHSARISWTRSWSPYRTTDFTVGFDRVTSFLVPEETSLGPIYTFSRQLASIGPNGSIPLDRAQNSFHYAGRLSEIRGDHSLTFGFEATRLQINGSESNDHRGRTSFRSSGGFDAVGNLRRGIPSRYNVSFGDVHRGFRLWQIQFFAGDTWQATSNFTVNLGLAYRPASAPTEVNDLSEIPYSSDLNNFAPSLGLAYALPGAWGIVRANYALEYGEIFPATFMQTRFNPPANLPVVIQDPDLLNPLGGFGPSDIERSAFTQLAPDLRTPYSHMYNFSWLLNPVSDWTLELGYLGSRSHKLLLTWFLNRAEMVEGIPLTNSTIDARRPDPRYSEVRYIHNGSRGYYDAGKVTLRIPNSAGFAIETSYWFSKAIDLGADYTNTAFQRDAFDAMSPSGTDIQAQLKSLSRFDQPHSFLSRVSYTTPALAGAGTWMRGVLGGWQISAVLLLKSGTPFSVDASDAPGFGNVDGAGNDNPILLDPSILGRSIDHPDTSGAMLPRSAFAFIDAENGDVRGNLGRNTFRKDAVNNINIELAKSWTLGGDQSVFFSVESLNLANHPQFAQPTANLTSSDFATITNTLNDGRAFQFSLRLEF